MKYQVCRPLTPIEYEALRSDIESNGVLVPVEIDENGDILDGHHRVMIWRELKDDGVNLPDYPCIVRSGMTEEQKRNHARKLNVLRRQMTKEEREVMMIEMRKDGMSVRKIAETTGVGVATVHRTISGVPNGTPEYINGSDGKQYPATQEKKESVPQVEMFATNGNGTNGHHQVDNTYEQMADDLAGESDGYDWTETEDEKPEDTELNQPDSMAVHYSSETVEHYTPKHIIELVLEVMGGIDLDPCSNSKTKPNVPAAVHYTIDDDGLDQEWSGSVYMNPPYGREIGGWVEKLCAEFSNGNVTEAIALVPARVDTTWWDKLTSVGCTYPLVCFVKGRLTFINNEDPAPFPSALVYLGDNRVEFYSVFSAIGRIWGAWNDELAGLVDYGTN